MTTVVYLNETFFLGDAGFQKTWDFGEVLFEIQEIFRNVPWTSPVFVFIAL